MRGRREGLGRRGGLERLYPDDGAAFQVTAGTLWAWSAYQQVEASTDAPFVPSRLYLSLRFAVSTVSAWVSGEYEVAVGPVGLEVTYAVVPFAAPALVSGVPSGSTFIGLSIGAPVGPKVIPVGSRLTQRARQSGNVAAVAIVGCVSGYDGGAVPLGYWPYGERPHLAGVHAAQSRCLPSGGVLAVLAGTAPTWGVWTEVLAAAGADLLVWGATIHYVGAVVAQQLTTMEFGTGAAVSEQARGRLAFPGPGYCTAGVQSLGRPVVVKKGERLVVRLKGTTGRTWQVKVAYEEL